MHKKDVLHHNEKILFHTHDGYEIYLFLNGDADFFVETCGHHLQRGDLILTKPFEFHNVIAGENQTYERLFINLKENVITELSQGKENLSVTRLAEDLGFNSDYLSRIFKSFT